MNLKFHYIKLALVILVLLACFCFNVYAQSSTTISNDTVVVTIKDENNNSVSLYLPESMNNDQCERRIYGTRAGVIGMFKTLYSEERRTESYEAAIRELCIQPEASQMQSYIDQLEEALHTAGVQTEDAKLVLDMVKHGAESIKKNYVKGGTPISGFRNKLANVGRKLNAAQKNPAFAEACRVLGGITADIKATAQLTDTIAGAFLLNSLSTDQAWTRLKEIERAVDSERQAGWKVDPALEAAIEQSEINLLAAQSGIGAFAVSVNDNLQEITDSAINLGATLAEMSVKFSTPVAMWVGAPLMTYNTLRGVSDQWEMAQDGVSLATVTKMVEKHGQSREGVTDNITSYGQYAFYSQMEETFSVGGAKLHDLLSPGSANKDWSQYYKQGKQNTTIIAMGLNESPTRSTGNLPKYLRKDEGSVAEVRAEYRLATKGEVNQIMDMYGSIPGGIVLEGDGIGLPAVSKAIYQYDKNAFVINGSMIYENPVLPSEMRDILLSIAEKEDLGISLGSSNRPIIYGSIPEGSPVVINCLIADNFLGHITYAYSSSDWLEGYKMAGGYVPKQEKYKNTYSGVTFKFGGYRFKSKGNLIVLDSSTFTTLMVPLRRDQKGKDGGHLPDFKGIDKKDLSDEYLANVQHLTDNFQYYMKERFMRIVNCYGEAAAFARALKRSGIDLKKLAASL